MFDFEFCEETIAQVLRGIDNFSTGILVAPENPMVTLVGKSCFSIIRKMLYYIVCIKLARSHLKTFLHG